MSNTRGFASVALAVCFAASAPAYAALSASKGALVEFEATGPGGLKIDGSTPDLSVAEREGRVVVEVALGNLSTGIGLRDRHMKEKYLEVARYPSATLTVERAALKIPAADAPVSSDVQGTLKLHGQERPVLVHYDSTRDAEGAQVTGRFHIKIDDFCVAIPSYLGVTVKPDVTVSARFHLSGN